MFFVFQDRWHLFHSIFVFPRVRPIELFFEPHFHRDAEFVIFSLEINEKNLKKASVLHSKRRPGTRSCLAEREDNRRGAFPLGNPNLLRPNLFLFFSCSSSSFSFRRRRRVSQRKRRPSSSHSHSHSLSSPNSAFKLFQPPPPPRRSSASVAAPRPRRKPTPSTTSPSRASTATRSR